MAEVGLPVGDTTRMGAGGAEGGGGCCWLCVCCAVLCCAVLYCAVLSSGVCALRCGAWVGACVRACVCVCACARTEGCRWFRSGLTVGDPTRMGSEGCCVVLVEGVVLCV